MGHNVEVEAGSGNVFADLGLPDADTHFVKAEIVSEIYRLVGERNLTHAEAAEPLGVSEPEVSFLFKGRFRDCSAERLGGFLAGLGYCTPR